MTTINDAINILRDLLVVVEGEPALAAFLPAANGLVDHAEQIANGQKIITPFAAGGPIPINANVPVIASEELARRLRVTFDRLPSIDTGGDADFKRAYATLLRNAHVSILHAIFEQHPGILPTPR